MCLPPSTTSQRFASASVFELLKDIKRLDSCIFNQGILLHPVSPISEHVTVIQDDFTYGPLYKSNDPNQWNPCNPVTWSKHSSLLLTPGLILDSTWSVCCSGVWLLISASFVEESCSWCHLSCSLRRCISSSSLPLSRSAVSFSWTLQLSLAWSSAVCSRSETMSDLGNMYIYAKHTSFSAPESEHYHLYPDTDPFLPMSQKCCHMSQYISHCEFCAGNNLKALCAAWRLLSSAVSLSVWSCSWSTWSLFSLRSSCVCLLSL